MDMTPFFERGTSMPVQRSRTSFFNPSWDVGRWDDFDRSFDFKTSMLSMQKHVADMERQMERMWQQFTHLIPAEVSRDFDEWRFDQGQQGPIIREGLNKDDKKMTLTFDVRQFKPGEITVKTVDQSLMVHAKHEETSDNSSTFREYKRMFTLPKDLPPESLTSTLSPEGVLSIEAPLPAALEPVKKETVIPIAHEKSSS